MLTKASRRAVGSPPTRTSRSDRHDDTLARAPSSRWRIAAGTSPRTNVRSTQGREHARLDGGRGRTSAGPPRSPSDEGAELLADERGEECAGVGGRFRRATGRRSRRRRSRVFRRRERTTQLLQRTVAADVEDHVIAMRAVGDVVLRVVDDVIGADRSDQVDLAVLQTPVTSAPKALAICTAKVPTPPDAPITITVCPVSTRP